MRRSSSYWNKKQWLCALMQKGKPLCPNATNQGHPSVLLIKPDGTEIDCLVGYRE